MGNSYSNMERVTATCRECNCRYTMRVWDEHKFCLACKKRVEELERIIKTCEARP